jgi:hypothetical protein
MKKFLYNATKAFEWGNTTKQQIETLEQKRDELYKSLVNVPWTLII